VCTAGHTRALVCQRHQSFCSSFPLAHKAEEAGIRKACSTLAEVHEFQAVHPSFKSGPETMQVGQLGCSRGCFWGG
jgi:hypothetical protein